MLIDPSRVNSHAAFESASYGVGQVMGALEALGFMDVAGLVAMARQGVAGQVEIMVRYSEAFGLVDDCARAETTFVRKIDAKI